MLKYCQKYSIYSYQSVAVIFVVQLAIPFLRYQLPVCFLGVPRDIKTIVWFRLWKKKVCGKHRSGLRNQGSIFCVGSFYLLRAQSGCEVLPTSCPVCTWGPHFARAKQPGHEAHHLSFSSAEVENAWSSTSSFHTCYNMVLN
jgi:hypothetical protein